MVSLTHEISLTAEEAGFTYGFSDLALFQTTTGYVLYAVTVTGGGISVFENPLDEDISLLDTQGLLNNRKLPAESSLEILQQDSGEVHVLTPERAFSGIPTYEISSNGSFAKNALKGLRTTEGFDDPLLKLASFTLAGVPHFVGFEQSSAPPKLYRFEAGFALQALPSANLAAGVAGQSVSATTVVSTDQGTWVLATDVTDHSVYSYAVSATTGLKLADQFGAADGLGINRPTALETLNVGAENFVILAAGGSSSLSVLTVDASGQLGARDHVMDTLSTRFQNVTALAVVGGDTQGFVVAAGSDDGVSLFALLPGGRLLYLDSLQDAADRHLENITALSLTRAGDHLHIHAGSADHGGLAYLSADLSDYGITLRAENESGLVKGSNKDDILIATASEDRLRGGAGQDTFVFIQEPLATEGHLGAVLDFNPTEDVLDLSGLPLFQSVAQLTIVPLNDGARLYYAGFSVDIYSAAGTPLQASDFSTAMVWNTAHAPVAVHDPLYHVDLTIWGTMELDALEGGGGNDILFALNGNDYLDGKSGADNMNGGPASDIYIVDNLGDRVIESRRWEGQDHVFSSVSFWLKSTHVEDLTLTGTGDLRGIGNGLVNIITGNAGDNILDGGAQNDRLIGGGGDDIYFVRAPQDVIIEAAGQGQDTVKAYRSFKLPDHVENLHLKTTFDFNGVGNTLDNEIVGTNGDNVLIGREGNDILRGQGGADTFVFDRTLDSHRNRDIIVDFTSGEDLLKLKKSLFPGLHYGPLRDSTFATEVAEMTERTRVIYLQDTGRLWFDPDGSGPQSAVLFAELANRPELALDDFLVF